MTIKKEDSALEQSQTWDAQLDKDSDVWGKLAEEAINDDSIDYSDDDEWE